MQRIFLLFICIIFVSVSSQGCNKKSVNIFKKCLNKGFATSITNCEYNENKSLSKKENNKCAKHEKKLIGCGFVCEVSATCSDGVQNGKEEGIDCGGDCPEKCGNQITITATPDLDSGPIAWQQTVTITCQWPPNGKVGEILVDMKSLFGHPQYGEDVENPDVENRVYIHDQSDAGMFTFRLRNVTSADNHEFKCVVQMLGISESSKTLSVNDADCIRDDGANYRGTANTFSVDGNVYTCQNWDSQSPNEHSRTPESYTDAGLEGNFCRNPDGHTEPWCYNAEGDTPRWGNCGIPVCQDRDECMNNHGGCSHICFNSHGSHTCMCPRGWTMGQDRRTCIKK